VIKLTHVGFRAHVKIASRIVSYRKKRLENKKTLKRDQNKKRKNVFLRPWLFTRSIIHNVRHTIKTHDRAATDNNVTLCMQCHTKRQSDTISSR